MRRLPRIVTVMALLPALSACGDDSPDERTTEPEEQAGCEAAVKVAGKNDVEWSGEGFVITGGDLGAFYKTTRGKRSLSLYPESDDAPATAAYHDGRTTYTTQADAGTVDVDPEGSGAEVDADATDSGSQRTVHIRATLTC